MSNENRPEKITINPVDGKYMVMGNPTPISKTFIYSTIETINEPGKVPESTRSVIKVIFPAIIDEEIARECRETLAQEFPTDTHEIKATPSIAAYPEGLPVQLILISQLEAREQGT